MMHVTTTSGTATNAGTKHARRLRIALPLLALPLSACGAEASAGGNSHGTTTQSTSQTTSARPSATNGDESTRFETPSGAVKSFVTQVLSGNYKQACMASAPKQASDKKVKEKCNGPQAKAMLSSLHGAWAKPGVALPPDGTVKVTKVAKNGDTAQVLDSGITLDGKTLRELELAGSNGNTKSFKLAIKLKKQDKGWHISGLDISV